ncbi:flagellar basal body-associated protein FliL [Salinarimonas soli]|uniref:Flagellar protein FliL n=1 Tax=Salinarimonas soli TaxID=1638099 RepID=A0A5B2V8C8_9HYPH|nr:flagellar basal body-associated protein FliL [Salinarimonas soli]KAA2234825.1 flagellar basal body-associated protein FliL [Salinarimonas soli]
MAKKDTSEDEAPDGEAKPSRRKFVIGGAVAVLAAAGGGGWFFLGRGKPHADEKPVKKAVAFLDVREMVVNLAPEPNQERSRFLKFKVALEVNDPLLVKEITPMLPRVEDAFQVFVRELRASDLEGSAGVYRLREELLRRVNVALHPVRVDAVLFKDIVVQ